MCNFWPGSGHHCLAQDEGRCRPTCSDHPRNEVDKLWFRMQSLGEKLKKESKEHRESLPLWHRRAALPTPAAPHPPAAAVSSQKARISFKKWEHTFPIPYQGPFLPSAMPWSPCGMACHSLDRASAQHG